MKDFIHTLRGRYASMLVHRPMDSEQSREAANKLNALRLAEAVLNKVALNQQQPDHALHIGILGPTQSGKSTLVNLLFAGEAAGVSALAGYTVHAQGFATDAHSLSTHSADALFGDFGQAAQSQLLDDNYKQYSVEQVTAAAATEAGDATTLALPSSIIWDSPDFDSIESGSYRSAVLRVAAIADVCILMVSKDKYADKSVWDMLGLLHPLGKPLVVCINKLNEPDTDIVLRSFLQRYHDNISEQNAPVIIPLPYIKGLDKRASQITEDARHKLIQQINIAMQSHPRQHQKAGAYRFIAQHWDSWLTPVLAEQSASEQWMQAVDVAIDSGMSRYREGYLEHPQKYDTFNRALAELLVLLEVPGLAGTLGTARTIVTWPVRKLMQLGKSVLEQTPVGGPPASDLEDTVLQQAAQHVTAKLSDVILDAEQDDPQLAHWWSTLSRALHQQQSTVLQDFEQQSQHYQEDFKPQIEAAAQKLYSNLQDQPAVLNSLRAARVSTDAAAVVLAVHSGGLAASDLVLAPAMLSLTTMLTESALGKYMDTIKSDLQTQQAQQVEQILFNNVLRAFLYKLPEAMGEQSGLMSINAGDVEHALQQLRAEVDEN